MTVSCGNFRATLQRLNIERLLSSQGHRAKGATAAAIIDAAAVSDDMIKSSNAMKFSLGGGKFRDMYATFRSYRGAYFSDLPFHVRWDTIQRRLAVLGRVSTGNAVVSYRDSGEAFRDMWKAVDEAKTSVLWQTYICKDDGVGKKTVAKMEAAHCRGCRTELLFDCGGNITGRRRLVENLKLSGASVIEYRPITAHIGPYLFGGMRWERSPAIRNHRKILIVDNRVGYCGGLNIGNEYCGKAHGGTGRFRDTHCSVVGPAVAHLREVYEDTKAPKPWKWSWTRWRKIASMTMNRRYKVGKSMRENLFLPITKAEHNPAILIKRIRWERQHERFERFMRWYHKHTVREREPNAIDSKPYDNLLLSEGVERASASARMKQRMEQYRLRALTRAKMALERQLSKVLPAGPLTDTDPVPEAEAYSKMRPAVTQVLCCNPHTRDWSIPYAFWQVSQKAHRRLWITTPYYMPHRKLLRAILYAARRGVDVRILAGSSRTTDPWFMWYASNYIAERLLAAGVRIYEYKGDQVMHAKTVVVDSIWSSMGSYNWDMMSNKNMEVCLCHMDYELAREMERHFLDDLRVSSELKYDEYRRRSWWLRFTSWFFYMGLQIAERLTFRTFWDADLSSKIDNLD